jgi:UDP-N-acetylmuramyl tripeptide synthase
VTYFGVDDDSLALPELQHASDSKHCRRCGHAYAYAAVYLAHLGHYRCPNCGQERPQPTVVATSVQLRGIKTAAFTLQGRRVELPLPGLYNVYNALGAAALTLSLGVALDDVVDGLQAVAPAFGRAETLDLGRPTSVLLVKNPAGANEVLRTLALEGEQLDLLGVLNDRVADGRDVSWVWDADWELLVGSVRRFTASGTRAAELALRMKYAGLDPERIEVVEPLDRALDRALERGDGPLYVIPTYTALLELRDLLTRRGHAEAYWR